MGNCFSAAVQQVVTELQQENDENNKPQQQQQQQHSQQQTTTTTTTWAQTAGGGAANNSHHQQQQSTHVVPSSSSSSSKVSPYYTRLPSDAEKIMVRNVYDGDTLTLVDERRVRLLGIDTPEIKEQQPFAQEAKNYTKSIIDTHRDKIYLSFESGQDKTDHYGRLLGFIYVEEQPNKYICINEGIVYAGYASVYTPNASSKINAFDKYTSLQNDARINHRGMWKDFTDSVVYKTTNGSAYHKDKSCQHIANSRNLQQMPASEAITLGLHPCRTCST